MSHRPPPLVKPRDAVAAAVAGVLAMTRTELVAFLDTLAGLPRIEEAGWRVREKQTRGERFPTRNAKIRERARNGESYGQLALAFGLTSSAVAKIVQRGRKKSMDAQPMSTATHG